MDSSSYFLHKMSTTASPGFPDSRSSRQPIENTLFYKKRDFISHERSQQVFSPVYPAPFASRPPHANTSPKMSKRTKMSKVKGAGNPDELDKEMLEKLQLQNDDLARSLRSVRSLLQTALEYQNASKLSSLIAKWRAGKFQRIVVLSGAGLSVSCGIPDFRSPGTGLYDNLQKYNLPQPEAIFALDYFRQNPRPFYTLAKEMLPGNFKPSIGHYFIRSLAEKQILLRQFTQNIDMLERVAGIADDLLVEAHGSYASAHCIDCHLEHSFEFVKEGILSDTIPLCMSETCNGYVKPDIVFFGESLPDRFFQRVSDIQQCDLMIVMGTSLAVSPFAMLPEMCGHDVPRLLLNREAVGPFVNPSPRDIVMLGDIDNQVIRLREMLGWESW